MLKLLQRSLSSPFFKTFRGFSSKPQERPTPAQVEIIKACVPILKDHGKTITTVFYKNMLGEHKELNNVFNRTHQITGHQAQALAASVLAYAQNIDNLGVLGGAVEHICQKHASLYITEAQYEIVGTYLLRAMKEVLGDALTPEIHDAWAVAYWQLARIMIDREKQLYDQSSGWTDWRDFGCNKKVKESEEITSFYLKPKDGKPLPLFLPGQYVSVQLHVPGLEYLQARQYSLSAAPNPNFYRISVKKEKGLDSKDPSQSKNPGWLSNVLHDSFKENDTIRVSHPRGDFFLDPKKSTTAPLVLISGGVGLTPLLSILETLVEGKSQRKISWIHATRSSYAQAFGKHVENLVKGLPNARSVVFNEWPDEDTQRGYDYKGRMDLEKLDKEKNLHLSDKTTEYYICGPERFMVATSNRLSEWGIDKERIKYEIFGTGGLPQ